MLCRQQPAWQPYCPPTSVGCKPQQPKLWTGRPASAADRDWHVAVSSSSCQLQIGAGCSNLTCLPSMVSGTSPPAIFWARPSATAVLPTPGSPIRQGLFLVRRPRIWVTRSISFFLPTTGSSFPCRHNQCIQRGHRHRSGGPDCPAGTTSVVQLTLQAQELYGLITNGMCTWQGRRRGVSTSS